MAARHWRVLLPAVAFLSLSPGLDVARAAPTRDQDMSVSLSEFQFAPAAINVQAGETVHFTLQNTGRFPHDMHIEGQGLVAEAVDGDGNIPSGQTVSWDVTFPAAGTYQFWCPVGNHRERGMVGELTATAATSLPGAAAGAGAGAQQAPAAQMPAVQMPGR